ncbi:MAG: nuclear transport factor 2 family protein [Actinobacteria bacterium]|nr:nuclear transport factor 2 family protein [Actinomycetota bacterium]
MTEEFSLPAPVTAFVDAVNGADTEAFVALFAEDGVIDDWGTTYPGPDGVRRWAGTDAIGAGAHMSVLTAHTEGAVTSTTFDWRSRKFNGVSAGIFTVRDGLLTSFVIPAQH